MAEVANGELDIDSLLAEGANKYGPAAEQNSGEIDVDSLLQEGHSKYGPADTGKPPSTLETYGETIAQGIKQVPAFMAQAIEGQTPYSEHNALDTTQEEAAKSQEEFVNQPGKDAPALGGLTTHGAIRETAQSIASYVVPTVAGLVGAGIGSLAGPAGTIAGGAIGTGFGTWATHRQAGGQFVRDVVEKESADQETATGKPLSTEEKVARQTQLVESGDPTKTGLAQSIPEYIGTVGELALLMTPQGKLFSVAKSLIPSNPILKAAVSGATKASGAMGMEQVESEASRQFQNPINVRQGLPEQSFGESAEQTALATLPFAGMAGATGGVQGYRSGKAIQDLRKQVGTVEARANMTPEQLATYAKIADQNGMSKLSGVLLSEASQKLSAQENIPEVAAETPVQELAIEPQIPEAPPVIADVTPQPDSQPAQPEQPETPDEALIARGRDYVNRYKERMALGGIPTVVSKTLRDAAQSFGVYDPNLAPGEMLSALDAKVSELENAQKTPGQQVADEISGSGWLSDTLAGNVDVLDANISAKQAATEAEAPVAEEAAAVGQVQPQSAVYVTEDGEIIGERAAEEPDYYAPESLAGRDTIELESLISAGNLAGPRLAAVNAELLRRKEGGENAEQITSPAPLDGSSGTQPGLREEGGNTAVSGAGVSPSGQEIGNIQQTAPETPISQEENLNDESQNTTAQETATEKPQEEITEAGHPKYVKANNLADAADITERNKATLPKDQIHDGDYQRGFADFDGLHIAIENKAGSFRSGKDATGKEWRQQMHSHYGEIGVRDGDGILKTGADGDLVDVFVNPNPRIKKSPKVYIVDQVNKDGSFDEHKVVLGYLSKAKAKQAYLDNYEDGWTGLGAITEMSMPEFKNWLLNEDPKLPVNPNVGKPKPEPKRGPAKERINNRYQLTGNEELQKAISKLGGLKLEEEIESVFGEYKKRALFNNGANSKYASEAVEILQGLGYQLEDEHALVNALEAPLLYSSTNGQSGAPFYTPEGFEKFAERHGIARAAEDEGQTELNSRIKALLDTTKEFLGQGEYDLMQRIVDRGEVTEENIRDYEQELDGDIARLQEQSIGYEPGPDDFLRGQDMRGANKPKPVVKPEVNEDMFVADEAERQAMERKQNLAAIEAAKAAKRTGPVESELFTDITVQKDITDIFEDLLPNKSAKVREGARAKLAENPNAERMQYIEDNFNDLLLELEQSGKVDIKC